MSGERPEGRKVTGGRTDLHHTTSLPRKPLRYAPDCRRVTSVTGTGRFPGEVNRDGCPERTLHVTMGAVTRPARPPERSSPDADLLRRIAAGDAAAVDDLYERFRRPAFALARRILADDTLAEDVLQDVFLSVWRDPSAFDGRRGSFTSWLMAMVHHKAVDAVRREASQDRKS